MLQYFRCKYQMFLLAFFWLIGLLIGRQYAQRVGDIFPDLLRSATFSPVSVPTLVASSLLPFLISALAVNYFPFALFGVCFLRAFFFGACLFAIVAAYGSGYWLMLILLISSGLCSCVGLFYYCASHLDGTASLKSDICVWIFLLFSIVIYILIISPLVGDLIT